MNFVEKQLNQINNKICWGISVCGPYIAIHFDRPRLNISETTIDSKIVASRSVNVEGSYTLDVRRGNWTIYMNGRKIGSKDDYKVTNDKAPYYLDGQKLVKFSVDKKNGETVLEFDLKGKLRIFPTKDTETDFLWNLRFPNDNVLFVYSDGTYGYDFFSRKYVEIKRKKIE